MPGIGTTLSDERRRQGRTLADAAAETRVRESYLAALEADDFDVLGGDVYARGFIRLYGKYLGLDHEALVEEFRANHERPEEITAIPGATIDEIMPMNGGLRQLMTQPVLAAVAIVAVLVVLFFAFRGGDERTDLVDPNAPGPSPAAAQTLDDLPSDGTGALADGAGDAAATTADVLPAPAPGGDVLAQVSINVTALEPVTVSVLQGQPVLSGRTLQVGESETLVPSTGEQSVVFTVSNFSGTTITVNGGSIQSAELTGRPVQITCTVGEVACDAVAQ